MSVTILKPRATMLLSAAGWRAIYSSTAPHPYAVDVVCFAIFDNGNVRPMVFDELQQAVVAIDEMLRDEFVGLMGPSDERVFDDDIVGWLRVSAEREAARCAPPRTGAKKNGRPE